MATDNLSQKISPFPCPVCQGTYWLRLEKIEQQGGLDHIEISEVFEKAAHNIQWQCASGCVRLGRGGQVIDRGKLP